MPGPDFHRLDSLNATGELVPFGYFVLDHC